MKWPHRRYLRFAIAGLLLVGFLALAIVLSPGVGREPDTSPAKKEKAPQGAMPYRGANPVGVETGESGAHSYAARSIEDVLRFLPPEDAKLLEEHIRQKPAYKGPTWFTWYGENGPVVLVYLNGVQVHPDRDEIYSKSGRIASDRSLSPAMKKAVIDWIFAALEKRGLTAEEASQELLEELYEQAKVSLRAETESTPTVQGR